MGFSVFPENDFAGRLHGAEKEKQKKYAKRTNKRKIRYTKDTKKYKTQ